MEKDSKKSSKKSAFRKRNLCPWVLVSGTSSNILFPGQSGEITLCDSLEKQVASGDSVEDFDEESVSFVRHNIDRAAKIPSKKYFLVFYKSKVNEVIMYPGDYTFELEDVVKYSVDDDGNILFNGILCEALGLVCDQNGKELEFADYDDLQNGDFFNVSALKIRARALSRVSVDGGDLWNKDAEFRETLEVDLQKCLNFSKEQDKLLQPGSFVQHSKDITALIEMICETYNRIENEKISTVARQRSKQFLNGIEGGEKEMMDLFYEQFAEVAQSGLMQLNPSDFLSSNMENIYDPVDRAAFAIFILPAIYSQNSKDPKIQTFLRLMRASMKQPEFFTDAAMGLSHAAFGEYIIERLNINYRKWEISNNIEDKLTTSLNKSQTEFMLQEKLRTIQNEIENLGSDGVTASDKASLKAQIENLKCPEEVKNIALTEYTRYRNIPYSSPESLISRNYMEWIIKLPWFPKETSSIDLNRVQEVMDRHHYGLKEIKDQIMEYLAVQNRRGSVKGRILCLVGAPGVGKTSLVKSIAEAVGRDYVRICLGGVRDEAEIRGHRRTYLGSLPGKFISEMARLKTNDPVILLDEIDKMSSDVRGDPSAALLEVLDPEQNRSFTDHYLDFPYDLSNVLFIATANSTDIPKPLLDRMDVVDVYGYSNDEKFHIAREYLIPKLVKENFVTGDEITFSDDAVRHIILDYTREQGVRNLERELDKIYRKAIVKIDTSDGKKEKPISIDTSDLVAYLGPIKNIINKKSEDRVGLVNGLAYSETGGDLLPIEACSYRGKGELKLTGKLGDVIKESCEIAFTAVKAVLTRQKDPKSEQLLDGLDKLNIHIHFPDGSTPKDGPSAGIAVCSALYSVITGREVRSDFAMTGEISLLGRVLPIGGLKEKLQGAINAGVFQIILPKDNRNDLEKVPDQIKERLTFHFVSDLSEVLALVIK